MGYCVANDGKVMNDLVVKNLILLADFETAHYMVSKFVCKRDIMKLHKKIIKHISSEKRTIDLAPRGFGKSTVGDVDWCITKILRNPNIRIMIGSKTQGQAEAFLKEIRTHFEQNEDLIRIFGNLKGSKWTDLEFVINKRKIIKKEATVTALGSSGQVVSKHFDIIIGDDLVGFENARTETQRTKLREWFFTALAPTLEPGGEIHILGTRYHPNDLYQDLIKSKSYSIQVQMAINKDEDGVEESLWEDKFNLVELQRIKSDSGSIIFGMQYQNDVELAKGNIFKAHYFRHYDRYEVDLENMEVYVYVYNEEEGVTERINVTVTIGVDLAISQSETADYFVMMAIGFDNRGNIYVLDYVRKRLTFDQQFNEISNYGYNKFPMAEKIGIEVVAYQMSMAQELKRTTTLPIIGVKTVKDKVSRAMRRSALFESGKVYFRSNMNEFEEELLLFPDGEHDDLFDGFDFAITSTEVGKVNVLDRSMFRI